MIKKALVVAVMLLAAMSARAQIGYKGQVALGVSGGISNVGGFVSTVRIDSYLSERSILGAGIILDRTRYDATQGDSYVAVAWGIALPVCDPAGTVYRVADRRRTSGRGAVRSAIPPREHSALR